MTYTTNNAQWQFFVVGGNADGTENGRIYFYRNFGTNAEFLYDYGTSSTNWSDWNVSYWTSNTQLVLTANTYTVGDTQTERVGIANAAAMHALGFDGSKLFTGVKIL